MDSIYVLIPVTTILLGLAIAAFFVAVFPAASAALTVNLKVPGFDVSIGPVAPPSRTHDFRSPSGSLHE